MLGTLDPARQCGDSISKTNENDEAFVVVKGPCAAPQCEERSRGFADLRQHRLPSRAHLEECCAGRLTFRREDPPLRSGVLITPPIAQTPQVRAGRTALSWDTMSDRSHLLQLCSRCVTGGFASCRSDERVGHASGLAREVVGGEPLAARVTGKYIRHCDESICQLSCIVGYLAEMGA